MSNIGHCLTQPIARNGKQITDKWVALEDEESEGDDPESDAEDEEGGHEAVEGTGDVYELY